MKVPVYINVDDDNKMRCGRLCPFLEFDECLLFSATLKCVKLEDGYEWQDKNFLQTERCTECLQL